MTEVAAAQFTSQPSAAARQRMLMLRGEPLLMAAWRRVLMMHFEVDAVALQRDVPFQLDLYHGHAFVSVVAFTMEEMCPRFGGQWTAWLFRPIATHDFLNVRTYVVPEGERGIHFLAEWLNNRLAVMLGPAIFGLPYRHGRIAYDLNQPCVGLQGRITDANNSTALAFHGDLTAPACYLPAEAGSLTEWLMERYTAFNAAGGRRRYFRVWHPPWRQCAAQVKFDEQTLLTKSWPWFRESKFIGGNYSPGFGEVWMGRPHGIPSFQTPQL